MGLMLAICAFFGRLGSMITMQVVCYQCGRLSYLGGQFVCQLCDMEDE